MQQRVSNESTSTKYNREKLSHSDKTTVGLSREKVTCWREAATSQENRGEILKGTEP